MPAAHPRMRGTRMYNKFKLDSAEAMAIEVAPISGGDG